MGVRSPSESEEVKVALSAAARMLGRTPKKKAALTFELLSDVLKVNPEEWLKNLRDRALLAVGFMGGFRRSELVTLRVSDLDRKKDNGGRHIIVISLHHSKTDQESRGTVKCFFSGHVVNTVKELEAWITAAGLSGDAWLLPRIRRGDRVQE